MGLRSYIIRRILLMIPTLIGATMLIFAVTMLFSPHARASLYITSLNQLKDIDIVIEKYGLNDPIYIQYFRWVTEVLQGNLGWSKSASMPVLEVILTRAPATFELVMFSLPLTIIFGVYLGAKSAVHRDKLFDHITRTLSIIGWSLPTFWFAILLLAIFYAGLGWFQPGRLSLTADVVVHSSAFIRYTGMNTIDGILNGRLWITYEALRRLVLPTITLTVVQVAIFVRVMRSSMLEALNKGYIVTARAKGLAQNEVINKHARRNALIPVITISGILAAIMLTGLVITETVFNYKGLGSFAAGAAISLDIPAVLGFAIFSGSVFVVANLIVDISYAYVDPRIRLG